MKAPEQTQHALPKGEGGLWGRRRYHHRLLLFRSYRVRRANVDPVFDDLLFLRSQRRNICVIAGHLVGLHHPVEFRFLRIPRLDVVWILGDSLEIQSVPELSLRTRQLWTMAIEALCLENGGHLI